MHWVHVTFASIDVVPKALRTERFINRAFVVVRDNAVDFVGKVLGRFNEGFGTVSLSMTLVTPVAEDFATFVLYSGWVNCTAFDATFARLANTVLLMCSKALHGLEPDVAGTTLTMS